MHSSDPNKEFEPLRTLFLKEMAVILSSAQHADCSSFVFAGDYSSPEIIQTPCNFFNTLFTGKVSFAKTKFAGDATFEMATFQRDVTFRDTEFRHNSDFFEANFMADACFVGTSFLRNAYFSNAKFYGVADFHSAGFSRSVRFRLTDFRPLGTQRKASQPSPVFSLASFAQPSVLFYKTDLSTALFVNCDLTRIMFSAVTWRERRNGKAMLFEELIGLTNEYARPLLSDRRTRNYELIAQLHHQLQNNYDRRLEYWKAGEFHYGAMEMQRLSIKKNTEWPRLRGAWHKHFSLIAWYHFASEYGENFVRPATLLLCVLLTFGCVYPVLGLRPALACGSALETYRSVWVSGGSRAANILHEISMVGHGTIAALDAATFQRNTEFTPAYPWGRFVAIVETLLTSSLFALFLLAVRRQFRR